MTISDDELIETLEHEADFRRQSGPQPKKVDVDFIADAEAAVTDLKAQPGDPKARKAARKVTNRIQNKSAEGQEAGLSGDGRVLDDRATWLGAVPVCARPPMRSIHVFVGA